jgi:GT2 family glycosyltransferase
MSAARVTVVVVTRNRRDQVLHTLDRLTQLPERPPVILVDNGSDDGTADSVEAAHPGVTVLRSEHNLGAPARTVGVRAAGTPYVAFADDDSWWEPGALTRAAEHFDASVRLGLLAARIVVGPAGRLDPVCAEMAASPLPAEPDLPGVPVLGFVACGSVVRRDAFLEVGGFSRVLFFGGEETVLAHDLAAAGWGLAYVDDVVARHHPELGGERPGREQMLLRNSLMSTWLRRPLRVCVRHTAQLAVRAGRSPVRGALLDAARRLPDVRRNRRVLPPRVEERVRLLERRPTAYWSAQYAASPTIDHSRSGSAR